MKIELIKVKIDSKTIKELAESSYGSMFKIAVDIEKGLIAAGGEFHADGEQVLVQNGSKQGDIWGANFYPFEKPHDRIQFSALINIRPSAGNRSMNVEDTGIRSRIKRLIEALLMDEKDAIA
jgi:hypothetical protein